MYIQFIDIELKYEFVVISIDTLVYALNAFQSLSSWYVYVCIVKKLNVFSAKFKKSKIILIEHKEQHVNERLFKT